MTAIYRFGSGDPHSNHVHMRGGIVGKVTTSAEGRRVRVGGEGPLADALRRVAQQGTKMGDAIRAENAIERRKAFRVIEGGQS